MSYIPYRRPPPAGFMSWMPPAAVTCLLWWFSSNRVSAREGAVAAILLFIPWVAYRKWQRGGATLVPLFALIALAHWAAFAMPLFLADPPTDPQGGARFNEATIFGVELMTLLGVVALGIGIKIRFRPIDPAMMPDVSDSRGAWRYLYCLLVAGTIFSSNEEWSFVLGSGGHQLMLALATVVPIAICVMLATKRMEGTATAADRYALAIFVAARIIVGIASGLLSPVAFMGVILALVHTSKYRRLPVRAILIIVPVAMFLQVGKGAFRGAYWSGAKTGSILEKAQFWLEASFDQWSSALSHNSHNDRRGSHALLAQSVDRIALLPQAANVLAKTPGLVPYQKGRTYSYFAATLIPRAVWPNKPSINEANRFYQVAYGVTAKEDLEGVSIAVGCLTESFINFGWWGVMPVMFVIGVIVGVFERTLLTEDSGLLFWGVGMALLSNLLTIEFQAAQYLGGLLQQIAVVFVVVLPVIRRRKTHRQPGLRLTEAV